MNEQVADSPGTTDPLVRLRQMQEATQRESAKIIADHAHVRGELAAANSRIRQVNSELVAQKRQLTLLADLKEVRDTADHLLGKFLGGAIAKPDLGGVDPASVVRDAKDNLQRVASGLAR